MCAWVAMYPLARSTASTSFAMLSESCRRSSSDTVHVRHVGENGGGVGGEDWEWAARRWCGEWYAHTRSYPRANLRVNKHRAVAVGGMRDVAERAHTKVHVRA
jgi:hypothetical protein